MATFDVYSEVDPQELRNAVDQARREAGTRYDFKGTDSRIELSSTEIVLESATEDRIRALLQVLEERLVRRGVSLKALDPLKVEEASKGRARQHVKIRAGIDVDRAKRIHKVVKDMGVKGVSSSTQGDRVRISSAKRDHLQSVIAKLKDTDFDIPLEFGNFRD